MISSKKIYLREKIANLFFPDSLYCICCGKIIDETRTYSLCDHCMERIRWNVDDFSVKRTVPMIRCAEYGLYERTIIFSLKYGGNKYIARIIAKIMKDRISQTDLIKNSGNTIIVPVPLHKAKERKRGFNQAALIGKYLEQETGIKQEEALVRKRETRPMRGLSAEERKLNLRNSMKLLPEYQGFCQGKTILLLDDFSTTGSTAEECARALRKACPDRILFLVFAARDFK